MESPRVIPQSPSRHDSGYSPAPSPSPSPSQSSFYHPRNRKDSEANAHPYAIKTTSTALLSRANSNGAGHKVNDYARHHHYVPPSPTSSSNDEGGPPTSPRLHRVSKHRYSRSLTEDGPPPLPAPPQLSSSEEEGAAKEADDTPTRRRKGKLRPKRASRALPPKLGLPDDPSVWTPFELSTYLASALKLTSSRSLVDAPSLPDRVALDISNFVRQKGMSGKFFLSLTEADLQGYSLNQLWRTSLLNISRNLREGNPALVNLYYDSPTQADDDGASDVSSPSPAPSPRTSMDGFAFPAPQKSSRHRHSASAGRVRDLVDNLERSTSIENDLVTTDNGRRSASPTKKVLPQRGRVESLFYPPTFPSATPANPQSPSIHQSRPLPLPPTLIRPPSQPSYPPLSSYPILPAHTGPAFLSQPLGYEYELGFRSGTAPLPNQSYPPPHLHDPTKQVFVVQHTPLPDPSALTGEDDPTITDHKAKPRKRLLPYPPVMGEAQLHHPRPRRGEAEGVSEQFDRQLAADDLEEPTMEELLKTSSSTQVPISGVDAWELMDSNDTVKRIPSDGGSSASSTSSLPPQTPTTDGDAEPAVDVVDERSTSPNGASVVSLPTPPSPSSTSMTSLSLAPKSITPGSKAKSLRVKSKRPQSDAGLYDPSAAELGRKAGYKTMASLNEDGAGDLTSNAASSVALRSTKKRFSEGMPQGLATLFDPSVMEQPVVADRDARREKELAEREMGVEARERSVGVREAGVLERLKEVEERASSLDVLREILRKGREEVDQKECEMRNKEDALKERQSALDHREWALDARERVLDEKEENVALAEKRLIEDRGSLETERLRLEESRLALERDRKEMEGRKAELLDQERRSLVTDDTSNPNAPSGDSSATNVPGSSSPIVDEASPSSPAPTSASVVATPLDHASTALWPIPSSFVRTCFNALLLPILGEERTEVLLQNLDPTSTQVNPPDAPTPSSNLRRRTTMTSRASDEEAQPLLHPSRGQASGNVFIPRGGKGSYILLMSIGVCAIALKVISRRMGAIAVSKR